MLSLRMKRVVAGLCVMALVAACGGEAPETALTLPTTEAAAGPSESVAPTTTAPTAPAPDTTGTGTAQGETQVSGTALPQFEQLEDDPAVGRTPPVVVGPDLLTGEPVRIESRGRPMVVAFYAHWCPHCQAEVEHLTDWLQTNDLPAGVDFYAVSVLEDDTRGNHPPDEWLRDEGWQHPVVADTPDLAAVEAFGLRSVPYLVAVDADNTVVLRFVGNVGPTELAAFFTTLLEPAG